MPRSGWNPRSRMPYFRKAMTCLSLACAAGTFTVRLAPAGSSLRSRTRLVITDLPGLMFAEMDWPGGTSVLRLDRATCRPQPGVYVATLAASSPGLRARFVIAGE